MIPAQFRAALVILRALLRPNIESIKTLASRCDPCRHPDAIPLLPRCAVRHGAKSSLELGQRGLQVAALLVTVVPIAGATGVRVLESLGIVLVAAGAESWSSTRIPATDFADHDD